MQQKIPLVCVVGPTASGKTKLSVQIAKQINGEVISADSMQIYQYMDIGTAKPTQEEMCGIPHHCIGFLKPDSTFSVADYVKLAHTIIGEIHGRGKLPVVAGGTGLYVSSLCDNIAFTPTPSSEAVREELKQLVCVHGNKYLWQQLNAIDPALAANLHPNNLGRVIRGIEIYRLTGITMSEHQRLSRMQESPYALHMLGLAYRDRELLYSRINQRVDQMLSAGLLDEVQALHQRGYSKTSVQAIGYKEFFDYLDGSASLADATEHVKQETRRYAKRQLTWFRRDKRIQWLYVDDYSGCDALTAQAVQMIMERKGEL